MTCVGVIHRGYGFGQPLLQNDPPSIGYDRTVRSVRGSRPSARHARIQEFSLARKHGGMMGPDNRRRGWGFSSYCRQSPLQPRVATPLYGCTLPGRSWRSRVIGPAIDNAGVARQPVKRPPHTRGSASQVTTPDDVRWDSTNGCSQPD